MPNVPEQRLTSEGEQQLAHQIVAIEEQLGQLLDSIPACKAILDSRKGRTGRTRAAAVNRLEAAVEAARSVRGPHAATAARLWAQAQDHRWRLAMSATRVVYREAHRLASNPNLGHPDLVQEGLCGLLDAAKRYEPGREIRFATYARWWVRAHMTRAIDLGRVVHLSAGACEQLRNLRKQIRLYEMGGTPWTAKNLASDLGLELERVRTLLGVGTGQSLEDQGEDTDAPMGLQLVDDSRPAPDAAAGDLQEQQLLAGALETALPPRHRHIILNRYGIGRKEPKAVSDIAKGMKLSRERVRQLEKESLQLLRDACARGIQGSERRARAT